MKKIAILTSGGDAPGMNACIRAVVRYALFSGHEIFGVERGYQGLIEDAISPMDRRSVSDILQRGGTILRTARSQEFLTKEGRKKAYDNLAKRGIDGLVVLGGDGSFKGAELLSIENDFPVVGVPCTIDNDLAYTNFAIGFDTAVNTVVSAVNNLRDTMSSHGRICIIEVMGRRCGDIALYSGLAGGAEAILVPEIPFDFEKLCERMNENASKGKTSNIIVLAEGVCKSTELVVRLNSRLMVPVRDTVLGHIQRGGSPTMADRVLGAKLGVKAVEVLMESKTNSVVGIVNNQIISCSISDALSMKKGINNKLYDIAMALSF